MKTRHGEKCVVSSTEGIVYGESLSIVFGLPGRQLSIQNRVEERTYRSAVFIFFRQHFLKCVNSIALNIRLNMDNELGRLILKLFNDGLIYINYVKWNETEGRSSLKN
jgi:hypothetical protein